MSKTYRPRQHPATTAIHDVSLVIPAGQFLGVLGPPGAGKTTLLKLIAGRLAPTGGHIRILGLESVQDRVAATNHVAMVQAGALNVSWQRNPHETLLADARCLREDRHSTNQRVDAILDELDLSSATDSSDSYIRPATWVRLAIAAALLSDPPILALDEPTLDLDEREAHLLAATLAQLSREHGKTIIIASRHIDAIREHCDRVVLLNQGRLVLDQPSLNPAVLQVSGSYQITVHGQLDGDWADWFGDLDLTSTSTGNTVLSGPIADQSALHGVLARVRDLGLPLLSVTRAEPELADLLGRLGGIG